MEDDHVLRPLGPIAQTQHDLLFEAAGIMLIVIVPVWLMAAFFTYRYRQSNESATYKPDWGFSLPIELLVWAVPAAIIVVLGTLVWVETHKLDPYRPLTGDAPPLEVEVVAQDWKWLFIYPEQNIATVNELVFPVDRPLSLKITSDTVMNSFFIPALGSQIYAMAGMQTQLNLLADAPGRFMGRNMQYSGDGFSEQHFDAIATSEADFERWVAQVRETASALDQATYEALAEPSIAHPVTYYSKVEPGLFDWIVAGYMGVAMPAGHHEAPQDQPGD
ncbi:MAG: ubiquinol oxidase subunit II [Rhodospirillales bacterium]